MLRPSERFSKSVKDDVTLEADSIETDCKVSATASKYCKRPSSYCVGSALNWSMDAASFLLGVLSHLSG